MYGTKGYGFLAVLSEIGYQFRPFWSEIGFGLCTLVYTNRVRAVTACHVLRSGAGLQGPVVQSYGLR